MIAGFVALGDRIAERWERAHYSEAAFGGIAADELRDSAVLDTGSLAEIADWFMTARQLPPQELTPFGHPPIRVYQGRTFQIDLLIWFDTPTAIHQHAFAGAFGVLLGSSFHTEYCFQPEERLGDEIAFGALNVSSSELLRRGDVRRIDAGERFIHSLIHLEAPTISVVVRTNTLRTFAPQLQYFPPGLAINPFHQPEPLQTQIELMRTTLRVEPALFDDIAQQSVRTRDLFFAYKLLNTVSRSGDLERLHELLRNLRLRHAQFADVLSSALAEERRQSMIRRHLSNVRSAEHRYLLALLLTAPNRGVVEQMMRARFPDVDPGAKILALIAELGDGRCADLALDKISLRLLQFAMRGSTFDDVAAAFRERFEDRGDADALRRRWDGLHTIGALRPILEASALDA